MPFPPRALDAKWKVYETAGEWQAGAEVGGGLGGDVDEPPAARRTRLPPRRQPDELMPLVPCASPRAADEVDQRQRILRACLASPGHVLVGTGEQEFLGVDSGCLSRVDVHD